MTLPEQIKAIPRKQKILLFNLLMTGSVGHYLLDEELDHYIGNHSQEKMVKAFEKLSKEDQWFDKNKSHFVA